MDNKESASDKVKRIYKNNVVPGIKTGVGQKALAGVGALGGTAYGMKKGKTFSRAAATGGLMGTAIGDTVGAVVIPQARLQKLHKKELDKSPSMKDRATLLAGSALPTAAAWGGILSLKKPRKFYEQSVEKTIEGAANGAKRAKAGIKFAVSKEGSNINNPKELLKKVKEVQDRAVPRNKKGDLGKTLLKASLAENAVNGVVNLSSSFITPESIVKKNKDKLNKSAFEIVNETFDKIATEFR